MKIDRKIIRKLHINVPGMLLVLVVLGGFLWLNQKPDFSEYHSYIAYDGSGRSVSLTDEQFERITKVYENDETMYYEWFDTFSSESGYTIHLYKTTDMSGEYDIMLTGGVCERHLLEIGREINNGNGVYSWKAWEYKKQTTAREVIAIIDEAIYEAIGE